MQVEIKIKVQVRLDFDKNCTAHVELGSVARWLMGKLTSTQF